MSERSSAPRDCLYRRLTCFQELFPFLLFSWFFLSLLFSSDFSILVRISAGSSVTKHIFFFLAISFSSMFFFLVLPLLFLYFLVLARQGLGRGRRTKALVGTIVRMRRILMPEDPSEAPMVLWPNLSIL